MIKIATAQLWVHDQEEALAFWTKSSAWRSADVTVPNWATSAGWPSAPPASPTSRSS